MPSTAAQQSAFGAPPSSLPNTTPSALPTATKSSDNVDAKATGEEAKGTKRSREEESDDGGAAMEEDSDVPMEASSDEGDE